MTALDNAPAHWTRTTIGEVADVRLGRQRSPKNHSGDQMRPYLRAWNVDWYRLRPDDIREMNFTDDEMETYALREDDILIVEGSGSATEVGKCVLVPAKFAGHAFQNTLIRVRTGSDIDPRWLMHRINAEAELGGFLALARGSGIFHLGSRRTGKWPIAVAPLEEQRAIVEHLERLTSLEQAAQRDLQSVQERCAVIRRSILTSPTSRWEGQSTDTLSEVLLDGWLRRRPASGRGSNRDPNPPALRGTEATGVEWRSLDSLCDPARPICYGILKPSVEGASDVPYVEVRDLRTLPLDPAELNRTTAALNEEFARSQLQPQDVVLAIRGSYGRAAVVPEDLRGANVSRDVARIAPLPQLSPRFLAHYLMGEHTQQYFRRVARGVAVTGINITDLRLLPVPLLPIELQEQIADEIDADLRRVARLESSLEQARQRGQLLRRSILKAAFEGHLTRDLHTAASPDELNERLAS